MFLLLIWAACVGEEPEAGPAIAEREDRPHHQGRDIVLILANGLRADLPTKAGAEAAFLEASGLEPEAHFPAAYAQTVHPWIGLGSLLTGLYPSTIPLCGIPDVGPEEPPWCHALPPDRHTMAEVLRIYGYETAFFSSGTHAPTGLTRGFDTALHVNEANRPGQEFMQWKNAVQDWWTASEDTPRFLVLTLPLPREEIEDVSTRARDTESWPEAEQNRFIEDYPEIVDRFPTQIGWPLATHEVMETLGERYLQIATSSGELLGEVLSPLNIRDTRDAAVVLTSLYGFQLGEWWGTQAPEQMMSILPVTLLDRTLRVPIHLMGAGEIGTSTDSPVELTDLMPTICALASAMAPADRSGANLLDDRTPSGYAYAEWGDMLFLREGEFLLSYRSQRHGINSSHPALTKAIQSSTLQLKTEGLRLNPLLDAATPWGNLLPRYEHYALHDVAADPMQMHELSDTRLDVLLAFSEKLLKVRSEEASPPADQMTAERIQALHRKDAIHYW